MNIERKRDFWVWEGLWRRKWWRKSWKWEGEVFGPRFKVLKVGGVFCASDF
jgi:hypothetical protein